MCESILVEVHSASILVKDWLLTQQQSNNITVTVAIPDNVSVDADVPPCFLLAVYSTLATSYATDKTDYTTNL